MQLEPDTRVGALLGEHAPVKSHHHQGYGRIGKGLREAGWADDGTVEALEDPEKRFASACSGTPRRARTSRCSVASSMRRAVQGGATVTPVLNPATEETIAELPAVGGRTTDEAVAAAQRGVPRRARGRAG